MSVYKINGTQVNSIYSISGNQAETGYDVNGNIVYDLSSWEDEITVAKHRLNGTAYYVVTIPQIRPSGQTQYPFVFAPNGANGGTQSTYDMVQTYRWYMATNGGYFDYSQTGSYKPYGITIQNSVLIREDGSYFDTNYTLTIDADGKLGYANTMASGVTAQDILNSGAVSSLLGLVPLVVNGQASGVQSWVWTSTDRLQQQIIGQFANGDYCIVTCEGRNYDSSPGFTFSESQALCLNMGLDFAMAVDGGGSTETVIGDTQLNKVYNNVTGRIVPTYIVFNGTDEFFVPSEVIL